jgi:hypothetical protein
MTIVTVDVDDEIVARQRPLTEADIGQFLRRLKDCGVEGVAWRLTCLGQAHYRSRVLSPPQFDAEDWRAWCDWSSQQRDFSKSAAGSVHDAGRRAVWTDWIAGTLKAMDPPEVGRRVCRDLGLKFLCWVDLFDGWFPGCYDPFLRAHPQFCWTARDGRTALRGAASYAFPETADRLVRVVEEINRYRPDGLYLCLSCHSLHVPEHPEALRDGFGFEAPVIERFKTRFGRGPATGDADRERLDAVRGEFMTALFERVRGALRSSADLWLPLPLGARTVETSPYMSGSVAFSYANEYDAWMARGLAQGIVLGDYEHIFTWTENWRLKGLPEGNPSVRPVYHLERLLPGLQWKKCPHAFFSGWMGDRGSIDERLLRMRDAIRKFPAAASWLHELQNVEKADAWDLLSAHEEELSSSSGGADA